MEERKNIYSIYICRNIWSWYDFKTELPILLETQHCSSSWHNHVTCEAWCWLHRVVQMLFLTSAEDLVWQWCVDQDLQLSSRVLGRTFETVACFVCDIVLISVSGLYLAAYLAHISWSFYPRSFHPFNLQVQLDKTRFLAVVNCRHFIYNKTDNALKSFTYITAFTILVNTWRLVILFCIMIRRLFTFILVLFSPSLHKLTTCRTNMKRKSRY